MDGNPAQKLIDFQPQRTFFIGVDSDGCAFDTMEIKHKECFIPNIVRHFELQPIARFAREAAEFVNLYSRWRGINRFPALARTLDLLEKRRAVRARGFPVPRLRAFREWLATEARPSNPALTAHLAQSAPGDRDELRRVLTWSAAVNATIAEMVYGVPPFPFLREGLATATARADIVVVSATPTEALEREWREHNLAGSVRLIAGQEAGTKTEHLRLTTGGRYAPGHVLMVGDAPGDLEAARANDALFYPINPGAESSSWQRLHEEGLDRFFSETYAGEYESALIAEFEALLPDTPPWETVTG
ncbi:MAG: HAD family hydrolase [Planctomycetes bacterium]|nr:HAD family hydrolase [Planctomycetota bacterium]